MPTMPSPFADRGETKNSVLTKWRDGVRRKAEALLNKEHRPLSGMVLSERLNVSPRALNQLLMGDPFRVVYRAAKETAGATFVQNGDRARAHFVLACNCAAHEKGA